MTTTLDAPKPKPGTLAEWKSNLRSLIDDVQRWAAEEEWSIHKMSKKHYEPGLGSYRAPLVKLKTAEGEIWIEPTARLIAGDAEGRVDILGWPSHSRAVMIRKDNKWLLYDDWGKSLRRPWSKKTLLEVIRLLAR